MFFTHSEWKEECVLETGLRIVLYLVQNEHFDVIMELVIKHKWPETGLLEESWQVLVHFRVLNIPNFLNNCLKRNNGDLKSNVLQCFIFKTAW